MSRERIIEDEDTVVTGARGEGLVGLAEAFLY